MAIMSICVAITAIRPLLEVIGGDIRPNETRTSWLYRIADMTGLKYRVVRAVWLGEQISEKTALKLREAAKQNDGYIVERLVRNCEILRQVDPEFYREEITKLEHMVSELRCLLDQGGQ